MAGLFSLYFIVGLASCTQGGFYYFQLLDRYAAGYSILIAVLFETIAVSWIYGTNRFCDDIRDMVGFYPGIYWRICWKFVAPFFLLFITVYGLFGHQPLQYDDYYYPEWANNLGWCIAGSSVMMIPLVAIIQILKTRGTFSQVNMSFLHFFLSKITVSTVETTGQRKSLSFFLLVEVIKKLLFFINSCA